MSFEPRDAVPEFDVPLHSVEAEMSALGAMMLSERFAEEALGLLGAEDFHAPRHQRIFAAMAALIEAKRPIDMLTLPEALRDRGELDAVGGPDYLTAIDLYVPSAANGPAYAAIVREKAIRRRAIKAAGDLARSARRDSLDVLAQAARALPAVIESGAASSADVDLIDLILHEGEFKATSAVSSGNPYLDALCEAGGLTCGQFSLSTAPSGEGKTTWANSVLFAALERGERCASLNFTDLDRRQILSKAVRWLCGIPGTAACRTDEDRRAVADALDHIGTRWDWEIYDAQSSPGARYVEVAVAWLLRKQAEGLARKGHRFFEARPIRLAVWDYAQMISTNADGMARQTRYMQQLHVAQEFRQATAQIGTAHAIMCAQLTDDKDREWIRDCKEWEFGAEFWFRVKKSSVKINKRRFGGKTDIEPPHEHHPRRQTFVPEGGLWDL